MRRRILLLKKGPVKTSMSFHKKAGLYFRYLSGVDIDDNTPISFGFVFNDLDNPKINPDLNSIIVFDYGIEVPGRVSSVYDKELIARGFAKNNKMLNLLDWQDWSIISDDESIRRLCEKVDNNIIIKEELFDYEYTRKEINDYMSKLKVQLPFTFNNVTLELQRADFNDKFDCYCYALRYAPRFELPTFHVNGTIWMGINPTEVQSHALPIKLAKGKVVVAGLGMGYYLQRIIEKEDVESIIVYEIDKNVIDVYNALFEPNAKVQIINQDIRSVTGIKCDFMYVDIYTRIAMVKEVTNDFLDLRSKNTIGRYFAWSQESMYLSLINTDDSRDVLANETIREWLEISKYYTNVLNFSVEYIEYPLHVDIAIREVLNERHRTAKSYELLLRAAKERIQRNELLSKREIERLIAELGLNSIIFENVEQLLRDLTIKKKYTIEYHDILKRMSNGDIYYGKNGFLFAIGNYFVYEKPIPGTATYIFDNRLTIHELANKLSHTERYGRKIILKDEEVQNVLGFKKRVIHPLDTLTSRKRKNKNYLTRWLNEIKEIIGNV